MGIEEGMLNVGEEWHPRQHLNETIDHLKEGEVETSEKNGMIFYIYHFIKNRLNKLDFRRQERHKRKKSDVFKGTLSEGMNKNESSDEDLKDVEIPMDSDDEEAQIRHRS